MRSLRDTALLVRAGFVVLTVRLALTLRRTEAVRARIAGARARSGPATTSALGDFREVAWSVTATSRLVPGASCLTQALAGQYLLAQRGRASHIRLTLPAGVAEDFKPHAWLISDETIILGGSSEMYATHIPFSGGPGPRPAAGS